MKYYLALILLLSAPLQAGAFKMAGAASYSHYSNLSKVSQKKKQRVIMYGTRWCGYCAQARQYFRANHIPFVEYDIERSKAAERAFERIRGFGTPTILVGNKRLNGFTIAGFRKIYR